MQSEPTDPEALVVTLMRGGITKHAARAYVLDALAAAREEGRQAGLEEAAKVCARLWDKHGGGARAWECADAIRALKEKK